MDASWYMQNEQLKRNSGINIFKMKALARINDQKISLIRRTTNTDTTAQRNMQALLQDDEENHSRSN